MSVRRRHFERILLAQKGVGNILDLGAKSVRMSSGPNERQSTAQTAEGTQTVQTRSMALALPLSGDEDVQFARYMSRVEQKCQHRVLAYMVGTEGSTHISWLEPTSITLAADGNEFFGLSSATVSLQTGVYAPAVAEAQNVIAAVPWEGTTEDSGELTSLRRGYEGPRWQVDGGASVNAAGVLSSGTATIRIVCPLWGAQLDVQTQDGVQLDHILRAYGWDGSEIEATTGVLTVPAGAWKVGVEITDPITTPTLAVVDPGGPYGPVPGGSPSTCQRIDDPEWPVTVLTEFTRAQDVPDSKTVLTDTST